MAINLASANGLPVPSGTLVDVALDIGDNASPGVFSLAFEAILDEQDVQVVTQSLTVVPAGQIPEPLSSWLFTAAALALLASRCRAVASERCREGARSGR